jgi:hypothetical protein
MNVYEDNKIYEIVESGEVILGSSLNKLAAFPDLLTACKNMLAISKVRTWCNQFDNGYKKWIPSPSEKAAIEAVNRAEK